MAYLSERRKAHELFLSEWNHAPKRMDSVHADFWLA
jgi:hypothetical protein